MKKMDHIKICDYTTYSGRNIYSHRPVMKFIVDIGNLEDIPTKDIEGFHNRLLNAFPGLKTNCCGLGYEGGFLERLQTGTYMAHVLEHVILEMQFMLGYNVCYGKTRKLKDPSTYYLIYEYTNEVCGLECAKAAVFILNYFIDQQNLKIEEFIDYLKKISIDAELGPSTSAIVEEAKNRGIPVTRIGNESLVRLGYGRCSRMIESTLTDATSCLAADISSNKQLTKSILNEHHIPVPYGKVVYSEISAVIAANQIGMPVVVKPFDGNQGKGVYLNLNTEDEIKEAVRQASKYSNGIMVENYIGGRDFRVLVVGNKVVAVSERLPARVIGDGIHTINELVDMVNLDESRGADHEKPLTKIKLDDVSIHLLQKNNLTINSIPDKGQIVNLRTNGNLSTGGTAIDYTDKIHSENAELAVLAANSIGIDIAGIDFVTDDITQSILDTGGAIVEVNTAPGIRMHIYPSEGKSRDVAKNIVDHLFPNMEDYQFPLVSVTGTNGKTTTVRMINHVLTLAGRTVGMTSTSGTYIGEKCICKGDNSGPKSARTLLSNKAIDCAVLETARGGMIREGLGYDLADVGIITNIAEDHLGIDGIQTLEELAHVKSLVTEAIKPGGYGIFNADDAMTPYLMARTSAKIILFSKSPILNANLQSPNYIHVYVEDGWIKIRNKQKYTSIVRVDQIPITCAGLIECNVENTLAAVSALYAMGMPKLSIVKGVKTFCNNVGRFNLYAVNNCYVMLDYGHNPAGYGEAIKACKKIGCHELIGIIGMPGDRTDSSIRTVANLCANTFTQLYIKEDNDKRGRKKSEVSDLIRSEIIENGFSEQNIHILDTELDALKEAILNASDDDFIVLFYEKLEPLQEYLNESGAVPVSLTEIVQKKEPAFA